MKKGEQNADNLVSAGRIMSLRSSSNHRRVSSIYHGNEDLYHAKECKHYETS